MATGGLLVVIQGIAKRVSSAINDWVFGMKETGMNEDAIRKRLVQEIARGKLIGELKNFATGYVPGFTGELLERFGRDTVSERIKAMREFKFTGDVKGLDTPESDATKRKWEQYVNTQAYNEGDFLTPPEPLELDTVYAWISVRGKNTCLECWNRHGQEKTMEEWIKDGLPRSNVCEGGFRCRCKLVEIEALQPADIPNGITLPPRPEPPKFEWVVIEEER